MATSSAGAGVLVPAATPPSDSFPKVAYPVMMMNYILCLWVAHARTGELVDIGEVGVYRYPCIPDMHCRKWPSS